MFHKFARGVTHFDVFGTTAHMLDVYSTSQFPGGWARINENDNIDNFDDLKSVTPLDCNRSVGPLLPIGHFELALRGGSRRGGGVSMRTLVSIGPRSTVNSHPDDKPACADPDWEQENDRYVRVQEALGLFVAWSIKGTDFSQKHDYPSAQWLQYQRCPGERHSRVFIGDKPMWRDLYIACNEAVYTLEGRVGDRFVEGFTLLKDGTEIEQCCHHQVFDASVFGFTNGNRLTFVSKDQIH